MSNPAVTHTPAEVQLHRIERFLGTLFAPGDLIEIRGLGQENGKIMRMLTRDLHHAAEVAVMIEDSGVNAHYCLNPVNQLRWYAKRTPVDVPDPNAPQLAANDDIAERANYMVDIDPVKPSGTASTEAQVAAALVVAYAVIDFLTARGWPRPIILMSGNGVHLLYRGDRGAAEPSLWPAALRYLSRTFSTSTMSLDIKAANPQRGGRMPFITNHKAGRVATVLSYPAIYTPVSYNLVYGLSLLAGPSNTRTGNPPGLDPDFDVQDLIDEFPSILMSTGNVETKSDGVTYYFLSECPFSNGGHRIQGIKSAITLRDTGIGYSCFGANHPGHDSTTFVDLLRLLCAKTGRRFSGEIWDNSWDTLDKMWKGEGVTMSDDGKTPWLDAAPAFVHTYTMPTVTVAPAIRKVTPAPIVVAAPKVAIIAPEPIAPAAEVKPEIVVVPEIVAIPEPVTLPLQFDALPYHQAVNLIAIYREAAIHGDDDLARTNPASRVAYRAEVERVLMGRDYARMAEALGTELLSELDDVLRATTPPTFADSDGNLTATGTSIMLLAPDLPLRR